MNMGFLNKILKKADKSTREKLFKKERYKLRTNIKEESKTAEEKKEPTIAELKDRAVSSDQGEKREVKRPIKAAVKKDDTGDAYRVLLKPVVTEKGTYLASQNKYLFEVAAASNKIEIKKAIKAVYGVEPLKVNIVTLTGKQVRYGRTQGRTKDRKKAIITLPQGQTIEVYEGV